MCSSFHHGAVPISKGGGGPKNGVHFNSPETALEYIALLSMLAKRLEQAKRR
jgi:hypothetical protein